MAREMTKEELDEALEILLRHMREDKYLAGNLKQAIGLICGFVADVRHTIHSVEQVIDLSKAYDLSQMEAQKRITTRERVVDGDDTGRA